MEVLATPLTGLPGCRGKQPPYHPTSYARSQRLHGRGLETSGTLPPNTDSGSRASGTLPGRRHGSERWLLGRSQVRAQDPPVYGLVWESGCPTVGIVCFVVHHQPVIHEVETVRLCFIRVTDHLIDCKKGPASWGKGQKPEPRHYRGVRTVGQGQVEQPQRVPPASPGPRLPSVTCKQWPDTRDPGWEEGGSDTPLGLSPSAHSQEALPHALSSSESGGKS